MSRLTFLVAVALCACLFLVGTTTVRAELPDCAATDCDCSDFECQEEAQAFFDEVDSGDPHGLDADNDGIACESLPPCAGSPTPTEDVPPVTEVPAPSPTGEVAPPPPVVETVAPTPGSPVPDTPPAVETLTPTVGPPAVPDRTPRAAESPAPAEAEVIGVPTTGAGSTSDSSWPWWPFVIAGVAVGAAGVLVAYQGRRAKP